MDDLERLKELAEKATPGDWRWEPHESWSEWAGNITAYFPPPTKNRPQEIVTISCQLKTQKAEAYGAYIAAANPEAVLNIIARVRELEGKLAAIERKCVTVYDCFSDTGTEKQTFHYCRLCGKDRDDVLVSVPITHSDDCPIRSVSPSP